MLNALYIVRHAEAMPHGTPGISDDDRPLTPEGEKRFRQAAEGLARLRPEVDRIATSPLPRARRTAEILAEALDLAAGPLEIEPALSAHQSAGAIAKWVETARESREGSLAIVGHNPWCEDLLALLLAGSSDRPIATFSKGAIAALIPGDRPGARWRLEWLAGPRLLRKLR